MPGIREPNSHRTCGCSQDDFIFHHTPCPSGTSSPLVAARDDARRTILSGKVVKHPNILKGQRELWERFRQLSLKERQRARQHLPYVGQYCSR